MKTFVAITFLFFGSFLLAQNPYGYKLGLANGLRSKSIFDIFQDSRGFIWMAGSKGISRYDGTCFVDFAVDEQSSRAVSNIGEDKMGRIWFCNFDGIIFYIEKNDVKRLNEKSDFGYVKYGLTNHYLYLVGKSGVVAYDIATLKIVTTIPVDVSNFRTCHANGNTFFVITDKLIEIENCEITHVVEVPSSILGDLKATIVQSSKNGIVFMSKYSHNFFEYNHQVLNMYKIPVDSLFVQNISFDGSFTWFCTTSGVIRWDSPKNEFSSFLSDKNISSVSLDKRGGYWFSTLRDGVYVIPDFNSRFYPTSKGITTLCVANNHLYVGTLSDEVFLFNDVGELVPFYKGKTSHAVSLLKFDAGSQEFFITSNSFKMVDAQGKQLANELIAVKDLSPIDSSYHAVAASGFCGLLKIADKPSGLDRLAMSKSQVGARFIKLIDNVQGKACLYLKQQRSIYFATNQGLFCIKGNRVDEVTNKGKPLLLHSLELYDGKVWGINQNGTLLRVLLSNKVENVPEEWYSPLFSGKGVTGLKVLGNELGVFTSNSLYAISNDDRLRKIVGLPIDQEITDATLKGDQLMVGTSEGIIVLDWDTQPKPERSLLYVNQLFVNDSVVSENQLKALSSFQNNLSIHYSLLSFNPTASVKLYYKINNEKWQSKEYNGAPFELTSLSPDRYRLVLSATPNEENGVVIDFKIRHPFYKQLWFILLVVVVLTALLYCFNRWKVGQINRKNQLVIDRINLEKNMHLSKLKAIKSQLNPHFFFNALNTLQSYILLNEKKQAIDYLSRFANLTRTILHMTEHDYITVAEEMKMLELYLEIEKERFNDDFTYHVVTLNFDDSERYLIPSMLLQPYVENAVKHGLMHLKGPKHLIVSIERQTDNLVVKIDDNGIGRKRSGELNMIKNRGHRSFASEAIQNKIQILNYLNKSTINLCYIDKEVAGHSVGTTVTITIPLNILQG